MNVVWHLISSSVNSLPRPLCLLGLCCPRSQLAPCYSTSNRVITKGCEVNELSLIVLTIRKGRR